MRLRNYVTCLRALGLQEQSQNSHLGLLTMLEALSSLPGLHLTPYQGVGSS